ncbi:MAG TPA: ABC transporter substrate-binding protein [Stellaceae bacterium]|nr:ABC transporter substrate-binding protein [Stellaceae bacterium]
MSRIAAFATAFALALIALSRTGSAGEAVVLQLSGAATFEAAGYYAALWQGYYRDAGLDVTIRPDGMRDQAPVEPVREIAEGRAQFGTGTMQLLVRHAQGLPVLLVAPIFQQSGAAVYYRADSDFSSPAALVNARLGRLPASNILDIELATALRAEGIDPGKIKSVTISPDQIVPALAERQIDAAIGSAWIVPWQAHERGIVLKSFNPANYRVEYYGDTLFTLQRIATAKPETVARFRAASLKGWEYALNHPDSIIARLVADKPGEPPVADIAGFDRFQADVARRLSRYPEIPLGYSNAHRWTQIEAGMMGAGVISRNEGLASFVYSPTVEPLREVGAGRVIPIAVVVLGIAALAALGLFWRRLPRIRLGFGRKHSAGETVEQSGTGSPSVISDIIPRRPRLRAVASHDEPEVASLPPVVNLNDVLAPLERRIRQRVRGKVRCRYSLFAELWPCRAEGGLVAACVLDLVSAATKAMTTDASLIVGTRNFTFDKDNIADHPGGRFGSFARITVRDNGPGLTETEFANVFDLEATSRPAVPGAVAVMERLGGFVRVESAEGVGVAVHLYFPRADEEAPSTDVAAAQVAE